VGATFDFLEPSGSKRFSTPIPAHYGVAASCALQGDLLVVALYSPISAGSQLFGLDRRTGKLRWTGEVDLPPIAHSAYRNETSVAIEDGVVVLRMDESMIAGLQLFELETGKRLLSVTQTR
jgi:hypothetical protein